MSGEIPQLIKRGESETVEFRGGGARVDSVAKSVCGLLNQQGGVILWGIADDGAVVGVENGEIRAEELNRFVAENVNPLPLLSVSVRQVGGKPVIVIDVAQGADKPYSVNREIWVRVGPSTLKAGADQSARLVEQSASQLERWERERLPGFGIGDCDVRELADARNEISRAGRFGIQVPSGDEELLRRFGLMCGGQLTNAAAVLFAQAPHAWFPNVGVRIVAYTTDKSGAIGFDTICEGPAIKVLKEAISIIQQQTGYSADFQQDQIRRKDVPAYALFALREGLVNAMVHRDYAAIGGSLRVEIYHDRLTIRNPGRLPDGWTTADLKKTHESHPRNPDIARIFYLRELMEQLGMGTQKLIAECRILGALTPVWKVGRNSVSLTLFRAPAPIDQFEPSERQRKFLEGTRPRERYKPSDYTQVTGISERQARRELAELQRHGLLMKRGKGPATVYVRTEKSLP